MSAKSVLIVEDDAILLFVNEKLITDLGHKVVGTAKTGLEAIEVAKQTNPDIIFMDIRLLGVMDGIEAMEEIRKSSMVPVVYLSGSSESKTLERAKSTNMLAFLIKPVSMEMIKEVLS